ncbi:AsnC family transcriptional regulator [miscellaneous Crenarchaeota group-1 archaeon SG8-32-1]|uniref:AsnC family transcriptional regulator n=1 Tax=miscellaneous Crenarchaeota group-1 archaeon SG8-32-1 TaxID=1685124 RepID=A0A0M0BVQ2_9ARCH|nr:MAG: AsnC family transcriptional regulator [miscellaneous Crenarchaeota group-1 archaeon SG8-32-1]
MDEVDRTIISQLTKDGRTTLKDLSQLVGFSSVGTKKRLDKLVENGILKVTSLLNLKELGMHAAIVLMEIESSEAMEKLLKRFEDCPRVVNIFKTMGGYNLVALVVAEDRDTLESISVEKCSLRTSEGIRRSEFIPIGNIFYSPFLAMREHLTHKEKTKTPCNVDCRTCKRYKVECGGCPATSYYIGKL